jgi:hypothetical protein
VVFSTILVAIGYAFALSADPPPLPPVTRPDYFEFVSLREEPDDTHTIAIRDRLGRIWYRERDAGCNLSGINREVTTTSEDYLGAPVIAIEVRHDGASTRLGEWQESRLGEMIGIGIDGQVTNTAVLHNRVVWWLQVSVGRTWRETIRTAAVLMAGGDPDVAQTFVPLIYARAIQHRHAASVQPDPPAERVIDQRTLFLPFTVEPWIVMTEVVIDDESTRGVPVYAPPRDE